MCVRVPELCMQAQVLGKREKGSEADHLRREGLREKERMSALKNALAQAEGERVGKGLKEETARMRIRGR